LDWVGPGLEVTAREVRGLAVQGWVAKARVGPGWGEAGLVETGWAVRDWVATARGAQDWVGTGLEVRVRAERGSEAMVLRAMVTAVLGWEAATAEAYPAVREGSAAVGWEVLSMAERGSEARVRVAQGWAAWGWAETG